MDNLKKLSDGELAYLNQRELNALRSGIYAALEVLIQSDDYKTKHSTGRVMMARMWKERRRLARQWEKAMRDSGRL